MCRMFTTGRTVTCEASSWTANVVIELQVLMMHRDQQEMGQHKSGLTCSCAASLAAILVMVSMWATSLSLIVSSRVLSLSLILSISCSRCMRHVWKQMKCVHVAVSAIRLAPCRCSTLHLHVQQYWNPTCVFFCTTNAVISLMSS